MGLTNLSNRDLIKAKKMVELLRVYGLEEEEIKLIKKLPEMYKVYVDEKHRKLNFVNEWQNLKIKVDALEKRLNELQEENKMLVETIKSIDIAINKKQKEPEGNTLQKIIDKFNEPNETLNFANVGIRGDN